MGPIFTQKYIHSFMKFLDNFDLFRQFKIIFLRDKTCHKDKDMKMYITKKEVFVLIVLLLIAITNTFAFTYNLKVTKEMKLSWYESWSLKKRLTNFEINFIINLGAPIIATEEPSFQKDNEARDDEERCCN